MTNDYEYLEQAIDQVTSMLTKKRKVWGSSDSPTFENFDIAHDFGDTGLSFGLKMCNLKLKRLKTRYAQHHDSPLGFCSDPDAEDSLIDLASYAVLALGMLYRERAAVEYDLEDKEEADERIFEDPEHEDVLHEVVRKLFKPEIAKLAREMMGEPMPPHIPSIVTPLSSFGDDPYRSPNICSTRTIPHAFLTTPGIYDPDELDQYPSGSSADEETI